MTHSLVAIHKRVILNEREAERRRLLWQARIEILSAVGHGGLGERRLECSQIAKLVGTTCGLNNPAVQLKHFPKGEIAHSGEAPVQFAILLEDALRCPFEIFGRLGDQIPYRSCSEILDRNVQALGNFREAALGFRRQVQGDGHGVKLMPVGYRTIVRQSNGSRLAAAR